MAAQVPPSVDSATVIGIVVGVVGVIFIVGLVAAVIVIRRRRPNPAVAAAPSRQCGIVPQRPVSPYAERIDVALKPEGNYAQLASTEV